LAALLLFVCLDLGLGTLAFRLAPDDIDNRLYRQQSPVYHHDLKAKTTAWAQWGPFVYRIFTNSLGFRDAAVRDVPLKSDNWRVVLIGDSFTEGLGYAYEDTFAGILNERLRTRDVDVLNAGVSSYSPVIYYRKLKYLIEKVKLDVDEVIVFLDISDIEDEARHYTLDESGNVVDQSPESLGRFDAAESSPSRVQRLKRLFREHSLTVAVADTLKDRFLGADEGNAVASGSPLGPWSKTLAMERANWTHDPAVFAAYGDTGLERAARSMDLLHDLLREHGISLAVVVYPWPNQVAARDRDSKQVRYWKAWAAARHVAFIDLFGEFIDGRDASMVIPAYYIKGDYHFNAAGHRRVAEALLWEIDFERRPLASPLLRPLE
jgi:lysophospholipase L1-like esterase